MFNNTHLCLVGFLSSNSSKWYFYSKLNIKPFLAKKKESQIPFSNIMAIVGSDLKKVIHA